MSGPVSKRRRGHWQAPSAWRAVRSVLGVRRRQRVGPAVYIERDATCLARSLESGGSKAYDVEFDHAAPVRIRVSASRAYPDLTGVRDIEPYMTLADQVTPGLRVLDLACGSGGGAAWLARRVGPSGGVIALDRDHEYVRYARRRYPGEQLAFEIGGAEALSGELDGAFHAAVLSHRIEPHPSTLAELWRVTAPTGVLAVLMPEGEASTPGSEESQHAAAMLGALPGPLRIERHSPAARDLAAIIARKPMEARA